MTKRLEEKVAFSIRFPKSLVEEIDQVCDSNYITRTSWLIKAAKNQLENDRLKSTEEILSKIAEKEKI